MPSQHSYSVSSLVWYRAKVEAFLRFRLRPIFPLHLIVARVKKLEQYYRGYHATSHMATYSIGWLGSLCGSGRYTSSGTLQSTNAHFTGFCVMGKTPRSLDSDCHWRPSRSNLARILLYPLNWGLQAVLNSYLIRPNQCNPLKPPPRVRRRASFEAPLPVYIFCDSVNLRPMILRRRLPHSLCSCRTRGLGPKHSGIRVGRVLGPHHLGLEWGIVSEGKKGSLPNQLLKNVRVGDLSLRNRITIYSLHH